MIEHLIDCAKTFGGDLQQMLVLAIVGQAALASMGREAGRKTYDSINASRIADICAIPRETVRRKLRILQQKRWVEQLGDQSWRIARVSGQALARRDLAALDDRGIERIARLFVQLEAVAPTWSKFVELVVRAESDGATRPSAEH